MAKAFNSIGPENPTYAQSVPTDADAIGSLIVSTIEASPISFTLADARRRERPLIFVNDAFCRTTGYRRSSVMGRNCRFLQGPETDPSVIEQLRGALDSAQNFSCRLLNYKADGSTFWNDLHITPLFDFDGTLIAFAGIQVDATAQVCLERQRAHAGRLEAVGQLAAGLAHEINNLLQPMLALPGLIRPALPPTAAEEREWLGLIEEHAAQTRNIVLNVLSFARESSVRRARAEDATNLFARAIDFVSRLLPTTVVVEKCARLRDGQDCGLVRLDETDARQVVANLMLNASQAMKGSGRIDVSLDATPDTVTLVIHDYGPGIAANVLDRIFEPFFTTKPVGEGTGLGLSVVHGIVRGWNGNIEVDSRPGGGTSFVIKIPKVGG